MVLTLLINEQILTSVWEKVQAMSVNRDVSTFREDSTAVALMDLNLSMRHNAKVELCSYGDVLIGTQKVKCLQSCISVHILLSCND